MMRVCHLDTCPVGIATQNPELRKRFSGRPEYVETFFALHRRGGPRVPRGARLPTLDEAVGHVECLDVEPAVEHWKAAGLDLAPLLCRVEPYLGTTELHQVRAQDHGLDRALDRRADRAGAAGARDGGAGQDLACGAQRAPHGRHDARRRGDSPVRRRGTARRHDRDHAHGLGGPELRRVHPARDRAHRSTGDTNDYLAKGLSGGTVVVRPPSGPRFVAEENIIAGNVSAYGATAGELFISGQVGERFCVRNSGATAVVEGVGDHGCEYMTGGRVVVLGPTGRNFAAGMSGGVAYVYDPEGHARPAANREMVDLDPLDDEDREFLATVDRAPRQLTGSRARRHASSPRCPARSSDFTKVMPIDYRRVLEATRQAVERGRVGRRRGDGGGSWLIPAGS